MNRNCDHAHCTLCGKCLTCEPHPPHTPPLSELTKPRPAKGR